MRRILEVLFIVCVALCASDAQADSHRTCRFLDRLVTLPAVLSAVRAGHHDPQHFQQDLSAILRQLGDRSRMAVFSAPERHTMAIFVGAARQDWKLNGANPNPRLIPGLTTTSKTVDAQLGTILRKFGCDNPKAPGGSFLSGVSAAQMTLALLALVIIGACLTVLATYRVIWMRRSERKICHVPALLRYDGTCTATTVLDISRGGAKIEAPAVAFPVERVVLHLPDHSIASRVAWSNGMFAGLTFDTPVSMQIVEELSQLKQASAQPENLTLKAPECFHPGCHKGCAMHQVTGVMRKKLAAQSA